MNKEKTYEGLLATAGFACALFLFLPLVVYLLNLESVTTSKMTILLCGGLLAVVTTGFLAAAMCIPRMGRWIVVICQIGLVAVVLLTAFPNRTGEMTGFDAFLPYIQNLWATAKLFVVCSIGAWLAWRKSQLLPLLSQYCLIVVLLVTGYVVFVPIAAEDKSVAKKAVIPANFTQLGETSNVIVVIFDSFTGYRMAEVLSEYPKFRTELDGFVYYPSAVASAFSTPVGVSSILTGDLSTSLINADAMERNADSLQNSFLFDALRLNLSVGFISLMKTKKTDIPHIRENVFYEQQPLTIANRFPAYLGFFALSLSRVTPGSLSSVMSMAAENITVHLQKTARTDWELLQSLQSESERRCLSGKMAFEYFINNLNVTKKTGSVFVMHSMMTHSPNNLTASGKYEVDKGTGYEGTSVFATHELARLCSKLRTLEIYDTTLIIAVADHGSMNIRDKTMGGAFPPTQQLPLEYNPLLMVKAPHSRGPCRDSSMSVWLGDVATTVRDFLGVPTKATAMFTTRSLLQPELAQRKINVPVFFRPDQVHYYDSLSKWIRQDFNGTFRDYGAIFTNKLEKLLQAKSQVKLFVGVDKLNMDIMMRGWIKDKIIPYQGSIEINSRLLTKLTTPGIAVVTGSKEEGYLTQVFTNMPDGASFIESIPPGRDCLAVGLRVPVDLARRLFPWAVVSSDPKTTVGFAAVSGPSYGPTPRAVVSAEDVNLDITWNQ